MPTETFQCAPLSAEPGSDSPTGFDLNAIYGRLISDGAQIGPRERSRARTTFDPTVCHGDVAWTNTSTTVASNEVPTPAEAPGEGIPVPTVTGTWNEIWNSAPAEPLSVPDSAPRRDSARGSPGPDSIRRDRFLEILSRCRRHPQRAGILPENFVGCGQGELVKAAKAWEHNDPSLWPWPDKAFTAYGTPEHIRLATAAAFLGAEVRRLYLRWDGGEAPEGAVEVEFDLQRLKNLGADSLALADKQFDAKYENEPDPF